MLILLAIFAWQYVIPNLSKKESKDNKKNEQTVLVRRVIDGDTFEIDLKDESATDGGKNYRVRMLGIDTPEKYQSNKLEKDVERSGQDKKTIQKLGQLASEFTKDLIDKKEVVLVPEPNYEDKDKYGRLLRYVYLKDGTFVNKKIIEEGFANAYTRFSISKLEEFKEAEKKARENKKGLWGEVDGLKQFDDSPKKK